MDTTPGIIIWGTFAIAVVGVVQPYAYALWRRYFRARQIDVHESFFPDITFAAGGPSVGLTGTLRNRNASSLITRIDLRITYLADGTEHMFTAFMRRKRAVSNDEGNAEPMKMKPWIGFQAESDSAHPYDILFVDPADRARIEALGNALQAAWAAYVSARVPAPTVWSPQQQPAPQVDIFDQAKSAGVFAAAHDGLMELCFWTAGDYRLTMEIRCADVQQVFRQGWDVTLTADHVARIEANADTLIAMACGMPPQIAGQVYTAFPDSRPVPA